MRGYSKSLRVISPHLQTISIIIDFLSKVYMCKQQQTKSIQMHSVFNEIFAFEMKHTFKFDNFSFQKCTVITEAYSITQHSHDLTGTLHITDSRCTHISLSKTGKFV